MPELPEVECVRLSLERLLVGRLVETVRVFRPDVIKGAKGQEPMLVGDKVSGVIRHGKQLALLGNKGGCVCIHLGMSGQLCVQHEQANAPVVGRSTPAAGSIPYAGWPAHTHVVWSMGEGLWLRFTDPRRFGGIWTFCDKNELITKRWASLGPDALQIRASALAEGLLKTSRSLKAAFLDQHLVAGLGNIYVDELLFNAKLCPLLQADKVDQTAIPGLVRRMRTLLTGAIQRGGSSLRDYVDGENQRGSQQERHRVYGRAGLRCKRRGCPGTIVSEQVAGRTTAWCPMCQPDQTTSIA